MGANYSLEGDLKFLKILMVGLILMFAYYVLPDLISIVRITSAQHSENMNLHQATGQVTYRWITRDKTPIISMNSAAQQEISLSCRRSGRRQAPEERSRPVAGVLPCAVDAGQGRDRCRRADDSSVAGDERDGGDQDRQKVGDRLLDQSVEAAFERERARALVGTKETEREWTHRLAPFGSILRTLGVLYWIVALGALLAALVMPRQRWIKVLVAACVVVGFGLVARPMGLARA